MVIYLTAILFLGLFGMASILLFYSNKAYKKNEEGKEEIFSHVAKKILHKINIYLKNIYLFIKGISLIKKIKFMLIAIINNIAIRIRNIQEYFYGRTNITRDVSSEYLNKIKEHKDKMTERLKKTEGGLVD